MQVDALDAFKLVNLSIHLTHHSTALLPVSTKSSYLAAIHISHAKTHTLLPSTTQYFLFACVYMIFPSSCINEPTRNFGHAFWFSFQTASTIGYSTGMYPDPDW